MILKRQRICEILGLTKAQFYAQSAVGRDVSQNPNLLESLDDSQPFAIVAAIYQSPVCINRASLAQLRIAARFFNDAGWAPWTIRLTLEMAKRLCNSPR